MLAKRSLSTTYNANNGTISIDDMAQKNAMILNVNSSQKLVSSKAPNAVKSKSPVRSKRHGGEKKSAAAAAHLGNTHRSQVKKRPSKIASQ